MSEVAAAFVTVAPSLKGFGQKVVREATVAGDTAGKAAGSRFGQFFVRASAGPLRAFGEAAVALFAADKIKDFFVSSVAEAREAQRVSAQTEQVIRSTGEAAGVSAQHVNDLASALSNQVSVDDEVIQSGENIELTFKNIRNEVGKGNQIFDRTAAAAIDMTAALHGGEVGADGLRGSTIQLGKALNDPIKGLTALTRVGVSFTEEQKEQIRTLVASGDILSAQKIILKELESEFGGAAAASATMGDKVSVAWHNIEEELGTGLLPVINEVEEAFLGTIEVVGDTVGFFQDHEGVTLALAGALSGALVPSLIRGTLWMGRLVAVNVAAAFIAARNAVYAFVGSERAAATATRSLEASLGPIGLALAAIGTIAGFVWGKDAAASQEAKQAADDYFDSLHTNFASLSSVEQSLSTARSAFLDQTRDFFDSGDPIRLANFVEEYQGKLDGLRAADSAVTANEKALEKQFGLTQAQVEKLAAANNIDLSGSLSAVRLGFFNATTAAKGTHDSVGVAAAAFADLGSAANTLDDDLKDLDTAWNHLIGNFVGMKAAEAEARDSIVDLDAALRKSHGSLRQNTAAGRAAVEQLANTTGSLEQFAQAIFEQTGSYDKTHDALARMVKRMTADLPKGSAVARKVTAQIEKYLSGLASKAEGEGERTGRDYGHGLVLGLNGQLQAVSAASAVLAAQIDKHARLDIAAHSPSEKARTTGKDYGAGLVLGLDDSQGTAADAGRRLADAASKATADRLKEQLDTLRSDRGSLADSIAQSLGGVDLSGFGDHPTADSIADFLNRRERQAHRERKLALSLEKQGVPHKLIEQIEGEDPRRALQILRALAAGDRTTLANIGGAFGNINLTARRAAREQAHEVYAPKIEARLESLERAVKHIGSDVASALGGATGNAKHKGRARVSS